MKRSIITLLVLTGLLAACMVQSEHSVAQEEPALMTWGDLTGRTLPTPSSTHSYGDDPGQVVDLWLPEGSGPHPVVLMIHGGCWQKAIADRTLMNYAAADLQQRGIAVWNIEYRGVDEAGGGYPGTFQDVRNATLKLLELGPSLNLDVDQIVAYGHSAGGHLAAWTAVQSRISDGSKIGTLPELPINAVIISGGLADLEASEPVTLETCLANIRTELTGEPTKSRPNVYSDTSVSELLPSSAMLISVNGERDRIAPPELGRALTDKILAAGGTGQFVESPGAGHVELIAPGTPAFETQVELIETYLSR